MNESMVTPYPLVDTYSQNSLVDKIRYPMAGMLSHQVTNGIYNRTLKNRLLEYRQSYQPLFHQYQLGADGRVFIS